MRNCLWKGEKPLGETNAHQNVGKRSEIERRRAEDRPAESSEALRTSSRKADHLTICLEKEVTFVKKNGFEQYDFEHRALPELNLAEIDTSTTFLGRGFALPFFIEAVTGGTPIGEKINKNLARAAQELGIGMGLGSQRAMVEDPGLTYTYCVRDVAPDIFLFGNIGAVNLSHYTVDEIVAAVEAVGADGLAVHLNPVHEMAQLEGDTDWTRVLPAIEQICKNLKRPVIAKEVGCGISRSVAILLESVGISSIDIAGAGGTCFSRVEYHRGCDSAKPFFEWGIPTAESLRQCRKSVKIPLIASGGIHTGIECAKALALGASLVGFALALLKPASESYEAVIRRISQFATELRTTMLLVGAGNIEELRNVKIVSSP